MTKLVAIDAGHGMKTDGKRTPKLKKDLIIDGKLAEKLVHLRIFEDENGKMNKSLLDEKGEMLIVSQFTLCGDCKKGTRPSFDKSAPPTIANNLYEYFISKVKEYNVPVQTGVFGAMMDVELINDGPVTFMVEK